MTITPFATRRRVKNQRDYFLYDMLTTDRAAGAVNATLAEPVGGARTVTDTNSKISISSGLINFATGAAANDGLWYPSQARVLGKTLIWTITPANTSSLITAGFDTGASGTINDAIRFVTTLGIYIRINNGLVPNVAAYTATSYTIASVMRAVGMFHFIKGGAFTNWTHLYNTLLGSAAGFPAIVAETATTIATATRPRVAKQTYIPVPLQSDSMSADTSDGLGNPEGGPSGSTYTNYGTWGVAAGVRSCSVLGAGSLGSSILATSTRNAFIEVDITRAAGSAGIRARQADDTNYIQCRHDGTNVIVSQVVAGVSTTLSTTAVAYSAGATMKFIADGLTYRAFYNNTAAGSGVLPDTTSTNHGVMTNHIGATFDNLVIWARTATQYEELDSL